MKHTSIQNEPLQSKVKWKESLNSTASFNKKGSTSSLLKAEKVENSNDIKINDKNNINPKDKQKIVAKPNKTIRQSKSPLFDKLHDQAKNLKSKIEDKRNQLMDNLKKKSVPKILKVSKNIERDANLFSERLYPYHKLAKGEGEEAEPEIENEYEYVHVATVRSNPLGMSGDYEHEEFKNNIDNIFHDVEEIRTLYGNKPEYVKFYRGVKSKKIQKYPFKPDIQIKRGSNSLEHSLKKSEEKKISRSFHSNSPCKKGYDLYCDSNSKSICNHREIDLCRSGSKCQNIKEQVTEFKESEEDKNNISSTSLPKKRTNSAESSNLKKSKEKSNKKITFAVESDKKDLKRLSHDEVKRAIYNTKSNDKNDLEIRNKIEANRILPLTSVFNEKKIKEDPLRISEKLYTKGINLLKKKEKLANEKSLADLNELAKFTFKPNVSKKKSTNKNIISNEEAVNASLIKNNSFTSGFSKSFDNMIAVKKETKSSNTNKDTSKSRSPFGNNILDKQNKGNNRSPSPNSNIEIINNLNKKIKKSNQWQFPNKHAKKIFDSAYIALINNFNSEMVNKINKDSPNDCSTNSSNNHSTLNKNQSNINNHNNNNINKSINGKESDLNSSLITRDRPSIMSKISENYQTVMDKRPMSNTGIYDRCKQWKENNNKNKNKMRENFEQERDKQCNFSPVISKKINKDLDDRFIRSESKYLDSYIKRRRNSLEHLEKQKNLEKKIFGKSFEKFTKKTTQPEEFNFNHSISRKSKDMRNSAINLHKPEKVKDYRREFKTGNFFNQPVIEFEESSNNKSNTSLNKNSNNNSLIDLYAKNRNSLNKTTKTPSNSLLEKNRKILNENLKLNKQDKKISNSINNNGEKSKIEQNYESEIILEDKNEYVRVHESSKFAGRRGSDNDIVNTNPADEYNDNIEKNIEEKLLNKDMSVNLIIN